MRACTGDERCPHCVANPRPDTKRPAGGRIWALRLLLTDDQYLQQRDALKAKLKPAKPKVRVDGVGRPCVRVRNGRTEYVRGNVYLRGNAPPKTETEAENRQAIEALCGVPIPWGSLEKEAQVRALRKLVDGAR